jgi:integrase
MARTRHRLSDRFVRFAKPGMYADGCGLWLRVTQGKGDVLNRSWVFRYAVSEPVTSKTGKTRNRERMAGLGSLHDVSLAQAREKAEGYRKLRLAGIDPITQSKVAKAQPGELTFEECCNRYIATHRAEWKSDKHRKQWESSLVTYTTVIAKLPVRAIDTALVLWVLEPIWLKLPDTASRVRARMKRILDWAKVQGLRSGDNPARWKGHLEYPLASPRKVKAIKHYPSLHYNDLPAFMTELPGREEIAARALEFLILTASRSEEVLGAIWNEIDFSSKLWTIPKERMKGGREHIVTLTDAALSILRAMVKRRESEFVFPGTHRKRPSAMAFLMLLDRMGRGDITTHGFRATFKTWAEECTDTDSAVIEAAMAHVKGDRTERNSMLGTWLDKRRELMTKWAAFCLRD